MFIFFSEVRGYRENLFREKEGVEGDSWFRKGKEELGFCVLSVFF